MFADRRVNFVNERREFFFVTPAQVREMLVEKAGGLLEFSESPSAVEFFQSRGRWPSFTADRGDRMNDRDGTIFTTPTHRLSAPACPP